MEEKDSMRHQSFLKHPIFINPLGDIGEALECHAEEKGTKPTSEHKPSLQSPWGHWQAAYKELFRPISGPVCSHTLNEMTPIP